VPYVRTFMRAAFAGWILVAVGCGSPAASPKIQEQPSVAALPSATHADAGAATTPSRARVTLHAGGGPRFLGENVLVDYCLENTSPEPFTIDVGGDYRGSSRSLRFAVEVRDAAGAVMPDPDPRPFNLGGLSYSPTLEPGEKWCQSLPLARYARIDVSGKYTLRITHDLGWPKGTAPAGEGSIELSMPDATQAEAVIARMDALPRDPNTSAGKVSVPYADFTALRYEVYVAPLLARARKGSVDALTGLAEIPTPSATRALVSLLGSADAKVARAAADGLAMRLPDPALGGTLGARNPFANELPEQRKYLSSHAWQPSFASDVRAAGRKLLASTDVGDVQRGAFMLEAVGTPADAVDLTAALGRAIERTRTEPREKGIYPVPRGACQELLRAATILFGRGAVLPAAPKNAGELGMWLVALGKGSRPAGWEAELGRALRHPIAYVRELALDNSPTPAPASLQPAIAADLAHADVDVQIAAVRLAERAKLTPLVKGVLGVVGRAKESMQLDIASNAAIVLGARYDCALLLASRLDEPDMLAPVLGRLVALLDEHGYGSSGTPSPALGAELAKRWKAFIQQHKAEIDAGKTIPIDATLPKDLLPPEWKLHRADGTEWP